MDQGLVHWSLDWDWRLLASRVHERLASSFRLSKAVLDLSFQLTAENTEEIT